MKPHCSLARILVGWLILAQLLLPAHHTVSAVPLVLDTPQTALPMWLDAQEKDGIAYFLFADPNIIRRYDLSAFVWLEDIPLPSAPSVFRVDDALYVAFGESVSRFALDGSGEQQLTTVSDPVKSLQVGGDYLFVSYIAGYYSEGRIQSVRKDTGEFIDIEEYSYSSPATAIVPSLRRMIGSTDGLSPSDTLMYDYNEDGTLNARQDSPYHGDHSVGWKHWVSPSETLVINDYGGVYLTSDLVFHKQIYPPIIFGSGIDDVLFNGDQPIILWQDRITGYDNALVQRGQIIPDLVPQRIFLSEDTILGFTHTEFGILIETYPLSMLHLNTPGQPVGPLGLSFMPDAALMGQDNVLYMLSRKNSSIFRWSVDTRRFLDTISLKQTPTHMAYVPAGNSLYLAHPDGKITVILLNESTVEQPFTVLPGKPRALLGAGEFLVAFYSVQNGYQNIGYHVTLNAAAEKISTMTDDYFYSTVFSWNEFKRRLYFSSLLWEAIGLDGTFATRSQINSWDGYVVGVRPDGSQVLLNNGQLHEGDNFALLGSLSNAVDYAVWSDETLYTARYVSGNTQIQQWDNANTEARTREITGLPRYLFPVANGLLVLTDDSGKLRLHLLDLSLKLIATPPSAKFLSNPSYGDNPLQVSFTNLSTPADAITSYLWDFGDGQTSAEPNPVHTYESSGYFSVKLSVASPSGQDAKIVAPAVLVMPLVVNFTTDQQTGDIPFTVHFTTSTANGLVTNYTWDFGDGHTGSGASVTHTYTQVGSFTVRVVASGPGGEARHTEPGYITVNPVTARFEASPTFGVAPLRVQFTNLSSGGTDNQYTWDFGDGQTSNEVNPTHIYSGIGKFTVTLHLSGPYGTDSTIFETPIQAVYGVYLPFIRIPRYAQPGHYPFNICQTFDLQISGEKVGRMTECVTSVDVLDSGNMQVNFSWTWLKDSWNTGCLTKYSDAGNSNMYLKDASGLRYDHFQVGGAAANTICMNSGETYDGWFLFPNARSAATTYTFYDGDNKIRIEELTIPRAP